MQITLRIVGYHFTSRLTATLDLCLIYFKITWALAIPLEHMHKKFEINQTKIKGGCQSRRKVVTHDPKSGLPLNIVSQFSYSISEGSWRLLESHASRIIPSNLWPCRVWPRTAMTVPTLKCKTRPATSTVPNINYILILCSVCNNK